MNFNHRESDHEGVADSKQIINGLEEPATELTLKEVASAFDAFKSQLNWAEFNDGF